ncbi:MAG: restriction endonuclease subunit S [Methylococcaceae bacterium]
MSEWQKVKLSEVLTHKKGSIKIDDDTEYKLCRVRLHRRGVLLRGKQFGHEIKTKKQQVCKSGDLIVAEMDAKFGGYGFIPDELEGAIVSSHYYLYELDKNKISQNYFETLISTDYIQNQIEAKGSTNYSSIRAKEFLEYEIPLASQELQAEISKRFLTFSDFTSKLNLEHENQQTYLTQLRQAILQEAIEGKLTADWRVKNPVQKGNPDHDAQALLETIKAEKQKLMADGKIKKDKPLAPINPDDVPFALPDGWVWVRLGDVCSKITDGTHHSPPNVSFGNYKYITAKNIKNDGVDLNNVTYVNSDFHEEIYKRCNPEFGDILYIKDGATTGIVTVNNLTEQFSMLSSVALLKPLFLNFFLMYAMRSPTFYNSIRDNMAGVAITRVTLAKIINAIIPLPPLAEQNAIVERVDRLLESVNALELQVTERKSYAQQLMQAVLREAFAG